MNVLPENYINTKSVPLSLMESGVEYPVYYNDLSLDLSGRLWVRRDQEFNSELEHWEDENSAVYVMRNSEPERGLSVRIPTTFSKRKKWAREDWLDPNKHIMIDEIVVS